VRANPKKEESATSIRKTIWGRFSHLCSDVHIEGDSISEEIHLCINKGDIRRIIFLYNFLEAVRIPRLERQTIPVLILYEAGTSMHDKYDISLQNCKITYIENLIEPGLENQVT